MPVLGAEAGLGERDGSGGPRRVPGRRAGSRVDLGGHWGRFCAEEGTEM